MTAVEKKAYIEQSALGYWSALGGLEVKDYQYGIEDYVVVVANAWYGKKSVHRVRVRIAPNGDNFILLFGQRFMFMDCITCR